MIRVGDIREWRTHDVVDPRARKIGTLEAIYVDTATDEPAMATVQVGLPTRHRLVFVPLDGAVVGPGYLKVGYEKSLVKKCPRSAWTTCCPPRTRKPSSGTTD